MFEKLNVKDLASNAKEIQQKINAENEKRRIAYVAALREKWSKQISDEVESLVRHMVCQGNPKGTTTVFLKGDLDQLDLLHDLANNTVSELSEKENIEAVIDYYEVPPTEDNLWRVTITISL